jgi:D-sedoheptulose 7-phosphate isomerase
MNEEMEDSMNVGLQSAGIKTIVRDYLPAFEKLLRLIDQEAIERIADALATARESGAMIYIAGNGGSAAIASHWVNDLGKSTKRVGAPPVRVMSLNDNVSWLTALANDEGYERVFAGQLENFARAGDVLVVISSSGNSVNLVRAVEVARPRGVVTIGLLGFDGGELMHQVDDYLLLPTEKGAYGLVEPGHQLICHILTACLAKAVPAACEAGSGK